MEALQRLQNWYTSQCDGDWEHSYGISIRNLDNPGWVIEIDIRETTLAEREFTEVNIERSEDDWIICQIKDNKFTCYGGPNNLNELVHTFLAWAEEH